jgi:hypothetical protein
LCRAAHDRNVVGTAAPGVDREDDGRRIAEALDGLYPGGLGIESLRQILFARRLA